MLIFGRTKHGVEKLSVSLNRRGFNAVSIHGDKTQSNRQRALKAFKDNVAYTMLERVACATCDRSDACARDEVRPFRKACKYASDVDKPTASAQYLNIRRKEEK